MERAWSTTVLSSLSCVCSLSLFSCSSPVSSFRLARTCVTASCSLLRWLLSFSKTPFNSSISFLFFAGTASESASYGIRNVIFNILLRLLDSLANLIYVMKTLHYSFKTLSPKSETYLILKNSSSLIRYIILTTILYNLI